MEPSPALSPRALWLSRLAAEMRFAIIRRIDERDTKCVSGTPQHAALTNATLATVKPQRELVGYAFRSKDDDPGTASREIGQSA